MPARQASRHLDRLAQAWYRCWYHRPMSRVRTVTVELPADLLRRAQKSTGDGITSTIRRGLELVTAGEAYRSLHRLKGKVSLSIDLDTLRGDRK